MNTLREIIRDRRKAEASRDASAEVAEVPPVRALQIQAWNGEKWVLSWGYFYAARHQTIRDQERLMLSFANHEVVLNGVRLALLLPEIAGFQLESLRDLPPKFRTDADPNAPFVSRVSVRSLTDSDEADLETT